ncbi:Mif2/CENP-C like-domain-containing protein [Xylaria palmicola]|nr:Mif2/CENP-C like-domain-containing protein [Xylaria palmicola]
MAPRSAASQRRQTQSQNEHVFALGKVGRKTGITIPDNGRRDEHGFEELDDLFSSPDRELQAETNGRHRAVSDDEGEEQDMEIDDGSELGPATTRKLQQQGRPSIPRGRSPIKTHLKSPARQNPHLPPTSSPTRGTIVGTRDRSPKPEVPRRLDFSKISQDKTMLLNGSAKAESAAGRNRKLTASHSQSTRRPKEQAIPDNYSDQSVEEDEEADEDDDQLELLDAGIVNGGDAEDDFSEEPDHEISHEVEDEVPVQKLKAASKSKPPGRRGRKPKATVEQENSDPAGSPSVSSAEAEDNQDEEPVKKRKGRPKGAARQREPTPPADPTPPSKSSKRGRPARNSTDGASEDNAEPRGAKRLKTSAKTSKAEKASPKPAPIKEKTKAGRKRKSSGVGVDSPAIQRGPPLPRSRGLVTLRREETNAMKTTRSGRASFKPLEWWRGEHVEYDENQENLFEDAGKRHFKMPTVKGVVRTEEHYESAPRRRGRPPTGRKPGQRPSAIAEEEIEREDWEYDPGRVTGEVVFWEPEHEFQPPGADDQVEIYPEELAISENAIQLRDIKDATFKFAKTLTLPFFGSGIVDLPPGAEKKPKDARKNQMVFFVHTGNVLVTVAQTEFSIAKGGMFFVPRGNTYQLKNETDQPARIFFAQGSEMFVQPSQEEE